MPPATRTVGGGQRRRAADAGAPPEVALNTAGIVPDTPEARETVLSTLGGGLTLIGFASGLLGLLPGSWSLLSVGVLVIGPLAVTVWCGAGR